MKLSNHFVVFTDFFSLKILLLSATGCLSDALRTVFNKLGFTNLAAWMANDQKAPRRSAVIGRFPYHIAQNHVIRFRFYFFIADDSAPSILAFFVIAQRPNRNRYFFCFFMASAAPSSASSLVQIYRFSSELF
jgi:hypothetical protein